VIELAPLAGVRPGGRDALDGHRLRPVRGPFIRPSAAATAAAFEPPSGTARTPPRGPS
jgi:hypothetical protein